MIGVPPEITQVERRAVKDSGFRVKASEVHLVDEPMAAAIGSGLPVTEPAGNMIIDIGGGTTDIAVISMAGTVYGRSLRVAGDAMDEAIIQLHAQGSHNLHIGERTAQQIKFEVGSAAPLDKPLEMEVKGRHVLEGVPRTVTVTDTDIREALAEPLRQIVQAVRDSLERIPPELSRRHLRSRRRPHRRRRAAAQPRQAAPRRDRAARARSREPAHLGRHRRRHDADRPAAAAQGGDRLKLRTHH